MKQTLPHCAIPDVRCSPQGAACSALSLVWDLQHQYPMATHCHHHEMQQGLKGLMFSFFPLEGLGSNSVQVTSENEFGGLEAKHICPACYEPTAQFGTHLLHRMFSLRGEALECRRSAAPCAGGRTWENTPQQAMQAYQAHACHPPQPQPLLRQLAQNRSSLL